MQRIIVLALLLLSMVIVQPTGAQFLEPLNGPLIATTPAQQDGIQIFDLGGAASRFLSFGSGEHHVWGFSPDGCRVLFTLDEAGNGLPRLYTARLDGSDQRELITYPELSADRWGIWEPNWSVNDRIAFTMIRYVRQPDGEIERETHIAWVDGSNPGPVEPQFYSVTGGEYTPIWSPNGAWLVYVSYFSRMPGEDIYSTAVPTSEAPDTITEEVTLIDEADFWVVSQDAQTKYRLTGFEVGSVHSPRWSPDSAIIGFIYAPSPNNDTFWMIANDPNAIPTELSSRWHLTMDLTWLPDGSAMLASARGIQESDENRLWRIPLLGNADSDASLFLADDRFPYTDFPKFSPDGRYLAFRNEYSLAVLDLMSNEVQRFAEDHPGNTPPFWSPAAFAGETACSG